MPGEQGACYKTGPSTEKVVLGDSRGEAVSWKSQPVGGECTIREVGMKGAANEARLPGHWFGSVPYNVGLLRSVCPWGLHSP